MLVTKKGDFDDISSYVILNISFRIYFKTFVMISILSHVILVFPET